jgi:hypothetical protein
MKLLDWMIIFAIVVNLLIFAAVAKIIFKLLF